MYHGIEKPVMIGGNEIQNVEKYMCLEQKVTKGRNNQKEEITKIRLG